MTRKGSIGAKLHSGSTMTRKSVNLTRNVTQSWVNLTPLFVKSAEIWPVSGSSLTRNGVLAPLDPFPGHADRGVFILKLVISRGRKSGHKSASYNTAMTVVNRYSEIGFSEVLSHLKPQSHYSDNQSPTSRSRQPSATISNQFPTKILDCLPTDRRLFADRSPSGRQPIANYSPTDYRTYFTFRNLISNHLESNRRLVADCLAWRDLHNLLNHPAFKRNSLHFYDHTWTVFMNTCWNFFWNEGDTIDYVNQLNNQSPTNLELLFLYFSIICIFQDQMYIHFVWQPCLVVDGCWCCIWKPLADQNCSAIINNHLPTIENHPEKGWLSEVGERLSM